MKYYKIVFSILVLTVLIIPLFHMNTSEITEQENRTLEEFPELKKKDKLNTDFGKEFESWLGDRFWGRNELIDARSQMLYKVNGRIENEKVFIGDDGWMFEKWNTVNRPSIKKQREKIEKDVEILKRFADKLKRKNVSIYLMLIPEREVLYQKYWERYYKAKPYLDNGEEITKLLSDYHNIEVIYPKKEFIEVSEKKRLFYKEDLHLTFWGTQIIVNLLQKKFNVPIDVKKIVPDKTYQHSYLASSLNLTLQKGTDPSFHFKFDGIKSNYQIEKQILNGKIVIFEKGKRLNSKNGKTAVIIGACYAQDIVMPILREHYSSILSLRTVIINTDKPFQKEALSEMDKGMREFSDFDVFLVYPLPLTKFGYGNFEELIEIFKKNSS